MTIPTTKTAAHLAGVEALYVGGGCAVVTWDK